MIRSIVYLLLPFIFLTEAGALQPDQTAALEKAKAKFEKDIAKAEETLLAGIDKAILQAQKASNKALREKLTYERDLFTNAHIVPTAYPADGYLRQRNQAIALMQATYQLAIKELTKAKKLAEATAIEDSFGELLKAGRGYGLAFPDLEKPTTFLIENTNSGMVIDTGPGNVLVLTPKTGKVIKSQYWQLEREDKGYLIRNVARGQWFRLGPGNNIQMWPVDRTKDSPLYALFRLNEVRHEIVIESSDNSLILTATEKKEKGVTIVYLTQEKKEEKPSPAQLWTLVEVK
jgi:hypothetical protein